MNTRFLQVCALAALTMSGALAAEDKSPAQAETKVPSGDTTIVTVNGQKIPLDLFRRFYADRLHQADAKNTPAMQSRLFNDFVNILVTAQDAQKSGLDKERDFELALEMQRLQLLSSFAIQNAAKTHKPTDEDLRKLYDERYGKEKGLEYKARHILVETEDEAKKVIDELKGGADFAELAKTRSLGPTGKDGGSLPWFGKGQMVQPFADATAALKPAEFTTAPVQTQFGWHVILLEDTRAREPPTFEDVKDELASVYQREMLGAYVAKLRESAKLKLNADLIKMSDEGDEKKPAELK